MAKKSSTHRKPIDQLGDLQRETIETLWELGQGSVQNVLDALNKGRRKKLAYTTVLTTLQNLQRSGWVKPQKDGRAYIYRPTKSKTQAATSTVRSFIKRAFGGDAKLMFESLLDDENLSPAEIDELRHLIEAKSREKNDESSR